MLTQEEEAELDELDGDHPAEDTDREKPPPSTLGTMTASGDTLVIGGKSFVIAEFPFRQLPFAGPLVDRLPELLLFNAAAADESGRCTPEATFALMSAAAQADRAVTLERVRVGLSMPGLQWTEDAQDAAVDLVHLAVSVRAPKTKKEWIEEHFSTKLFMIALVLIAKANPDLFPN